MRELVIRLKMSRSVPGVPMVFPWADEKVRCLEYHEHSETARCVEWTEK